MALGNPKRKRGQGFVTFERDLTADLARAHQQR
jgi:hypothetical protein